MPIIGCANWYYLVPLAQTTKTREYTLTSVNKALAASRWNSHGGMRLYRNTRP